MGFFFSLFKLSYIFLTVLILVDHFEYIYKYFEVFKPETFFSNNQFAHTMGMFLGLLFRISGMLSAMKEKIALTTTYGLFIILILLLMSRLDFIFYLYFVTAVTALLYVIILKYRRSKARKARSRANRALAAQQQPPTNCSSVSAAQVALDLASSGRAVGPGHTGTLSPSAPPYDELAAVQTVGATAPNAPHLPGTELYYNPQHNTPPPSYAELYETK